MSQNSELSCQYCNSKAQLLYCHVCATLQCRACVLKKEVTTWMCSTCNEETDSALCGGCGEHCQMVNQTSKIVCANCESTRLSEPETILRTIGSDYFSAVEKVTDILPKITEINRSFDFFTALVRQCRLAGLMVFPQIETSLSRCSKGIIEINARTKVQLTKIRKDAIYEILNLSYLKNIEIDQYRLAERAINNIESSISQTIELVTFWVDEVNIELDRLYSLSKPLSKHYELLQTLQRYLPEGVRHIAGIVPAVPMRVKKGRSAFKHDTYIIFSEDEVIFLPKDAVTNMRITVGKRFSYKEIEQVQMASSSIKGTQLHINFNSGEVQVNAPPKVIKGIEHYFELIQSEKPLMIGSPKTILEIEAETADKFEVKRACDSFIEVFKERLFGERVIVQTPDVSMKELQQRFETLKMTSDEIDNRARNLQINLDEYRSTRNQINDSLRNLRNDFRDLRGHFTSKNDLNRFRLDSDLNY
ncbi:MAG: hypothetical protein INQ03_04970 [Candidatus Heimdallarchaeota archaeon]|nr:hypothetical protein [Candidatus Heimdallarchaeota archaeon]